MSKIAVLGYPGHDLFEAAGAGLRRLRHTVVGQVPSAWTPRTAIRPERLGGVVACGLRGNAGDGARYYQRAKLPVCVIDFPHLRRDGAHWRVTPPDLHYLPEFDGAAPRDRLDALDVTVSDPRERDESLSVLILGQRSGDPTHGLDGSAFRRWAAGAMQKVRSLCRSPVIWRPHPGDVYDLEGADEISDPREEPLEQAMERAWLVVTYSSNGGLDALLAGLPVIADGNSVYKELTGSFDAWQDLAPAEPDELEELLARIAYTQWTLEEIHEGVPFEAFFGDAGALAAQRPKPAKPPAVDAEPAEDAGERQPPADLEPEGDEESESDGQPPSPDDQVALMEQLMAIDGVGPQTADALLKAGITYDLLTSGEVGSEQLDAASLSNRGRAAVEAVLAASTSDTSDSNGDPGGDEESESDG